MNLTRLIENERKIPILRGDVVTIGVAQERLREYGCSVEDLPLRTRLFEVCIGDYLHSPEKYNVWFKKFNIVPQTGDRSVVRVTGDFIVQDKNVKLYPDYTFIGRVLRNLGLIKHKEETGSSKRVVNFEIDYTFSWVRYSDE